MNTTASRVASLEAKLDALINAMSAKTSDIVDTPASKALSKSHAHVEAKASQPAMKCPKLSDFKTIAQFQSAKADYMRYLVTLRKSSPAKKAKLSSKPETKASSKPAYEGITATQAKLGRIHLHGKDATASKAGVYTTKYARVVARLLNCNTSDAQHVSIKTSKGSSMYQPEGKGFNYVVTLK